MKKLSLLVLLSVFVFCGCNSDDENNEITVVTSFEGILTSANSEFTTDQGTIVDPTDPYSSYIYQFKDRQNLIEMNYYYYIGSGFGGGFTYTNKIDLTTPGYTNNSAITATGKYGTTYLTAFTSDWTPSQIALLDADKYKFKGAWVTNSVYAYLAIKDGNDNYLNNTKFENDDWFKLTATGYNAKDESIGKVEMYLADYRNNKTTIIKDWVWFDFSPIAAAQYIKFEMTSSDNDENGMKTPAYFCMDGITLIQK